MMTELPSKPLRRLPGVTYVTAVRHRRGRLNKSSFADNENIYLWGEKISRPLEISSIDKVVIKQGRETAYD